MDNKIRTSELIEIAKSPFPKVRCIKKTLESGTDINFQNEQGYTALMYAVEEQHDRIVEYLLGQGADPLLKNHCCKIASDLVSPYSSLYPILKDFELLFATKNNELHAVKMIIEAGALVNFQGPKGYSALMIAVEQKSQALIEYLLSIGADLEQTQTEGRTVFDLVSDLEILNMLKNAITTNAPIDYKPPKFINTNKNYFFSFIENPDLA
jgi:ankyrin repeat protein